MRGNAGRLLIAVGLLTLYIVISGKYACLVAFADCFFGIGGGGEAPAAAAPALDPIDGLIKSGSGEGVLDEIQTKRSSSTSGGVSGTPPFTPENLGIDTRELRRIVLPRILGGRGPE